MSQKFRIFRELVLIVPVALAGSIASAQTTGDSNAGQQLFTTTLSPQCSGCHSTTNASAANSLATIRNNITNRATAAGAAGTMSFAKALEALDRALTGTTLGGAVTGMNGFYTLTSTQRGDLAAYIAGLAGLAPILSYSPNPGGATVQCHGHRCFVQRDGHPSQHWHRAADVCHQQRHHDRDGRRQRRLQHRFHDLHARKLPRPQRHVHDYRQVHAECWDILAAVGVHRCRNNDQQVAGADARKRCRAGSGDSTHRLSQRTVIGRRWESPMGCAPAAGRTRTPAPCRKGLTCGGQ